MAAKLKACQEIMPPANANHQHQQRRKTPSFITSSLQKTTSPNIRSLNGSLNASKLSIPMDQDETLQSDATLRNTSAV